MITIVCRQRLKAACNIVCRRFLCRLCACLQSLRFLYALFLIALCRTTIVIRVFMGLILGFIGFNGWIRTVFREVLSVLISFFTHLNGNLNPYLQIGF